jgi:DNA-binding transcriptional LysR family regulator
MVVFMDLRHLRYFIAVAEELHFTRAAERLGIKQPPLSLQIRQLEQEIGTPLFRRLTRGAELTESGILLLEKARAILCDVEKTKLSVQMRARGETGRIQLGFAGATSFNPLIPALVADYRRKYPQVAISPETSHTPRLIAGLYNGELDVAFIRPGIGDVDELGIDLIVEERMLIVVPVEHHLARKRSVPLAALAKETWILHPRSIGPGLYDEIIAACHAAGFSPEIGQQQASELPSAVHLVSAGFGISIVPQSLQQIHAAGIVYVRIRGDGPRAPISLAYRRNDRSAAVRNFVSLVKRNSAASGKRARQDRA